MGFVKYFDKKTKIEEYVLVSQLFGSSNKGSKLLNIFDKQFHKPTDKRQARELFIDVIALENPEEREALADLWVKIINAGYYPYTDIFTFVKHNNKLMAVPLDLDLLVGQTQVEDPENGFFNIFRKDFINIRQIASKLSRSESYKVMSRLKHFVMYFLSNLPEDKRSWFELELGLFGWHY